MFLYSDDSLFAWDDESELLYTEIEPWMVSVICICRLFNPILHNSEVHSFYPSQLLLLAEDKK
jgi:hypothetical protein